MDGWLSRYLCPLVTYFHVWWSLPVTFIVFISSSLWYLGSKFSIWTSFSKINASTSYYKWLSLPVTSMGRRDLVIKSRLVWSEWIWSFTQNVGTQTLLGWCYKDERLGTPQPQGESQELLATTQVEGVPRYGSW